MTDKLPAPSDGRATLADLCRHLAEVARGLGYLALRAKLRGIASALKTDEEANLADALLVQCNPDGRNAKVYIEGVTALRRACSLLEWLNERRRQVDGNEPEGNP